MAITISKLQNLKEQGKKFATITAYDASFANIFDKAEVAAILIGDSLGMTIQGNSSTLQVTIEEVAYHTKCVSKGVENALIIADLPFMTYSNVQDACINAAKLMQAGANVVKLEGGSFLVDTVKTLTRNGVAVCGHLGLTPQSVNIFGGYKIQGREEEAAQQIFEDAIALQEAGACMIVLECIPRSLASKITKALRIPTIGIGAGKDTDGQILVMHDALGLTLGKTPKFAKNFLAQSSSVLEAIKLYKSEVEANIYPDDSQSFD
ncbi:MAG: 3-methyl-2-oxobutanoate hydroxymethyltransferase [Ruminobacter sp.]|nr:3-methyl-2-oxobutanoate hydroxymethyltransferase [Ruminobacter sp.]